MPIHFATAWGAQTPQPFPPYSHERIRLFLGVVFRRRLITAADFKNRRGKITLRENQKSVFGMHTVY